MVVKKRLFNGKPGDWMMRTIFDFIVVSSLAVSCLAGCAIEEPNAKDHLIAAKPAAKPMSHPVAKHLPLPLPPPFYAPNDLTAQQRLELFRKFDASHGVAAVAQ